MWGCPKYIRDGFCPPCVVAVRAGYRSCVKHKQAMRCAKQKRSNRMTFLRRQASAESGGIPQGVQADTFTSRYPAVSEYMTAFTWPGGEARLTSTLMIFVDHGGVKVCLKDREAMASVWVCARGVDEAMDLLEAAVASGRAEWRPDAAKRKR